MKTMQQSFFTRYIFTLKLSVIVFFSCVNILSAKNNLFESTHKKTIITIDLKELGFDTLLIVDKGSAQQKIRPRYKEGLPGNDGGAPDLPVSIFTIGIPEGTQPQASVLFSRIEEVHNIDITPIRTKEADEYLTRLNGLPDEEIYNRNQWYPQHIVSLDSPSQFRQQLIVRVEISPFQYNPVKRVLRIHHDLRVAILHPSGHGIPNIPSGFNKEPDEAFYQSAILNYDKARSFRKLRTRKVSKTNSLFNEGPLYKIAIRNEGIHRITGQTLANNGIDLTNIVSDKVKVYNNGGRQLSRAFPDSISEQALLENAIYVSDGGDGRFDENDFMLFYGRGVTGFEYDTPRREFAHYIHQFESDNYYWLSLGTLSSSLGKRMIERPTLPRQTIGTDVNEFTETLFVEEDLNVLFESDQTWFGFMFTNNGIGNEKRYQVQLTHPAPQSTLRMRFNVYAPRVDGAFGAPHRFSAILNNINIIDREGIFGNDFNRQDPFGWIPYRGNLINGVNELVLSYLGSGDAASLYLDYFEMNYQRQLRMPGPALIFSGQESQSSSPYRYRIDNVNASGFKLFDISDFSNVVLLNSDNWLVNQSELTFIEPGDVVPHRYIATTATGYINVTTLQPAAASNLRSPGHAADMIIISHEDFLTEAQRLADLRAGEMQVKVVDIQNVFDEFSGGLYDPVAIRDFLKYAYDSWQKQPLFVVLYGDGDYDPKNILNKTDKNWIPSYHTDDLHPPESVTSRVTDSWFTYVAGNDRTMDMAIGRIPARSKADAEAYIDKLEQYENNPTFGVWRNKIVTVADDETVTGGIARSFEDTHIEDTEILINFHTPDFFDVQKLYFTEFQAVQSASISGIRKPTATETLLGLINDGALIINYAGHGNPDVWGHERVLDLTTDFDRIQNGSRQAVWIAATCTFGKFDMPERQSFAEELLLAPERGAIAVLATTRDVFASANARLNQILYDKIFSNGQESERLGIAMMNARMQTNNHVNDEKFHLYGDPSMRLAIPQLDIILSSPDTITALSKMEVNGVLADNSFNGTALVEVFDSRRNVNYSYDYPLSNGTLRTNTIRYTLPGNSLFRGEAQVTSGDFCVKFIIPKDLTYGATEGRLTVYFSDASTNIDGHGFRDHLAVGGTLTSNTDIESQDVKGPEIDFDFSGVDNFFTGGYVGPDPVLHIALIDSASGINIAGEIGHNITLEIDGNSSDRIDVTDLFNYGEGEGCSARIGGALSYQFKDLAEGRHTVVVKAWDNLNNSNLEGVEFVIASREESERLALKNIVNYPNPFRNETSFTFDLTIPASKIQIKIYTIAGRLIRYIENYDAIDANFNFIPWDGRDEDGDQLANGVYLYKIIATRESFQVGGSQQAEEIGKLVVQR